MRRRGPNPPEHLSERCRDWWRSVVDEYDLEQHHLHLLRLGAEAIDRAEEARVILAAEGIVVRSGDTVKAHPAVAIERDARLAAARLIRELDLDVEAPAERSRPPALRSNRRP
jgi:P27 family predicted phage terminase small subunit